VSPFDADYIGGHIKGSLNFPSGNLDVMMPTLIRKLEDKSVVVFHCALSQQRGPRAALQYIRERDRLVSKKESSQGQESGATRTEQQQVLVLDQGFVGWQEEYGKDEQLTEGYRWELWKEGYWG
jgi:rhodanese-related sulfurtransferase